MMVKPDITNPDKGNDISVWHGGIIAIIDDEALILTIPWDSLMLKCMLSALIA